MAIFRAVASTSTTLTITATDSLDTNYMAASAIIYSGSSSSPAVDQIAEADVSASTSWATGTTGTTTSATEVLIGAFGLKATGSVITQGSGYTYRQAGSTTNTVCFLEDKAVSSTGTYQATATNTVNGSGPAVILTLK
jgi:hypothetical protein